MAVPLEADPIQQALSATQATLAALQRLQEQTAQLHKQFLDSQEAAQRTLAQLVNQQAALMGGTPISMPTPPPKPVLPPPAPVERYAPTPAVIAPPPPRPVAAAPSANGHAVSLPAPLGVIASTLLGVVAEKTGYPVEMLDLGMSMVVDLRQCVACYCSRRARLVNISCPVRTFLPELPAFQPDATPAVLGAQIFF